MTTVTDGVIQSLIAAALTGTTAAGNNVFTPRTWRTPAAELPVILIQSPGETKQNFNGRTGPSEFYVQGVFRIVGRVYAKSGAGDAGAMAAEFALGLLKRQIEVLVINAPAIQAITTQCLSVQSLTDVKSDGGLTFAELQMNVTFEYEQFAEDFAQPVTSPFTEIAIYADLLNVYSPTGDFTGEEPFTGTPAPRTSGPDGRPEATVLIELPQE